MERKSFVHMEIFGDRRTVRCPSAIADGTLVVALLAMVAMLPAAARAEIPGLSPGSTSVTQGGALSYGIPLGLPPGTAGMQPELSLGYHSGVGNGVLGVGWSLSGLSSIGRCEQTIAEDGHVDGVDHDADDQYCLDGSRLIAISGSHGASGTEYRTMVDGFSRITSNGSVANLNGGSAPLGWTVEAREGDILDYGGTSSARVVLPDTDSIDRWLLTSVTDRFGNRWEVDYTELGGNTSLPAEIRYTSNAAMGLVADRTVEFVYEERPDTMESRILGSQFQNSHRLAAVRIHAGSVLAREYRFTYAAGAASGRSLLTRIDECDGEGNCLAGRTFDWQEGFDGVGFEPASTPIAAGDIDDGTHWHLGDWNGDGLTDALWYDGNDSKGQNYWFINDGNGGYTKSENLIGRGWIDDGELHFGDFNGDGLIDVFFYRLSKGKNRLFLNNGDLSFTFIEAPITYSDIKGGNGVSLVDVDADGVTDVVWLDDVDDSGVNRWFIGDGQGGFSRYENLIGRGWVDDGVFRFADFNDDGLADVFWYRSSNGKNRLFLNNGDLSFTFIEAPITYSDIKSGTAVHVLDVTSDGIADVIWHDGTADKGDNRWLIGDGAGGFTRHDNLLPTGEVDGGYFLFGDFNGDRTTDVLFHGPSGGQNRFYLNDGRLGMRTLYHPLTKSELKGGDGLHLGDFDGNGVTDLMWYKRSSGENRWYVNQGVVADLLIGITDTLGATTSIVYSAGSDPEIYEKGSGASYPVIDTQLLAPLIALVRTDDGVGGEYTVSYRYGAARADVLRRQGLGFGWREATDEETGVVNRQEFLQDYPFLGVTTHSETRLADGTLIGESDYTYVERALHHPSGADTIVVERTHAVESTRELDGTLIRSVATDTEFDDYSNPIRITVDYGDGYRVETVTEYVNDTNDWLLGLSTRTAVTHTAPGAADITRASEHSFVSGTRLVDASTIEPGTEFEIVKSHSYDGFGNETGVTMTAAGEVQRSTTTAYDIAGRFGITSSNALGHSESHEYDDACGAVTSLTGPNGLTTTWQYDGFCRPVREQRADGTETTIVYQFDSQPYSITRAATGRPDETTYFDGLGRTTRTATEGFDGRMVYQDREYDHEGRLVAESLPYYDGDPAYWTRTTYDVIGRPTTITTPDNEVTTHTYQGLTTTTTNPLNLTGTVVTNVLGWTVETRDADGNGVFFEHDAAGRVTATTDPDGNRIETAYDLLGRKTSMTDPDMGTWTYAWDVWGNLTAQIDADGQTITSTYDLLGRRLSRSTVEGASTWTFDSAANGIGKLAAASGPGGYTRTHTYDGLGRPEQTTVSFDGQSFVSSQTYDDAGRVDTTTYPGIGLTVRNVYNARGYLAEVRDDDSGELLWRGEEYDADGAVRQETFGSGLVSARTYDPATRLLDTIVTGGGAVQDLAYTFDAVGNLTSRFDHHQGLAETFAYDNLNRLTTAAVNGVTKYAEYDALGNIVYKSDVGDYFYGENGAGPHAVTRIDASSADTANYPTYAIAPEGTYHYDPNGQLTVSNGRIVTWTSFHKPAQMSGNGQTLMFTYGPEHQRIRKESESRTIRYGGPGYEEITEGGSIRHKYYVSAGSATLELIRESGADDIHHYRHGDHLGSADVITDGGGAVVERLSFDPWGNRRNSDWSYSAGVLASESTRGFTGHEQDDEVGLVNMGARIYDPLLGRFLSPDPTIPDAGNLQSYNRYTYVNNRPLSLTDPSGLAGVPVQYTVYGDMNRLPRTVTRTFGDLQANYRLLGGNDCGDAGRCTYALIAYHPLKQAEDRNLAAAALILKQPVNLDNNISTPLVDASTRRRLYNVATGEASLPGVTPAQLAMALPYIHEAYGNSREYHRYLRQRRRAFTLRAIATIGGAAAGHFIGVALEAGTITAGEAIALSSVSGGIQAELTGGNFIAGAVSGYIGAASPFGDGFVGAAVGGCISSEISGGSCGEGAATAAVTHLMTSGPSEGSIGTTDVSEYSVYETPSNGEIELAANFYVKQGPGKPGTLGQNPFWGKSFHETKQMLKSHGYQLRFDAGNGTQSWYNPVKDRAIHLDVNHGPPKGPHIGVTRPRPVRNGDYGLPKSKDFGIGDLTGENLLR